MRVNIFVDDLQVGTRNGCDVLVEGDSCKKASIGSTFFSEGLPRDICETCMMQVAPGKPVLSFKSSHYDIFNESYSTKVAAQKEIAQKEEAIPKELEPPKFPVCPHCGARSFAISQIVSEVTNYDWSPSSIKFIISGEPQVEQYSLHHCKSCSKEVPSSLLSDWIS